MLSLPRHSLLRLAKHASHGQLPLEISAGALCRRWVHIQATPSIDAAPMIDAANTATAESPDASFEVLGASYSLLSISLSPSQELYTRRGTLVGLSGDADGTVSALRILEPFRRVLLGIPFLYQKIVSTSRVDALVSTKSSLTSFSVLHLTGTTDWMIAQRSALLAWTGRTLSATPTVNLGLTVSNWGQSQITGRGLLALSGKGQIFSIELQPGERYVAHPNNIVAYSLSRTLPRPYRFKSSALRFQVPQLHLNRLLPESKFFRTMQETVTWKFITSSLFQLRTWTRRTIWGDRLFLQFEGPATLLIQSRAAQLSDTLTTRDIHEIADTPAGVTQKAVEQTKQTEQTEQKVVQPQEQLQGTFPGTSVPPAPARVVTPPKLKIATIGRDGKVEFAPAK